MEFSFAVSRFLEPAISIFGVLSVVLVLVGAFRSGALKSIRLGSFELQASDSDGNVAQALARVAVSPLEGLPFETEQLARYYSQILAQSRVSFWFSLIFASIGFMIIVLGAFTHTSSEAGSTIARFVAGGVVDAVAALFFVQSKRAQDSMGEFFDKLRRDRNHLEARKLCESVDTPSARDALRVRLSLHYADVGSPDAIADGIIKACLLPPGGIAQPTVPAN